MWRWEQVKRPASQSARWPQPRGLLAPGLCRRRPGDRLHPEYQVGEVGPPVPVAISHADKSDPDDHRHRGECDRCSPTRATPDASGAVRLTVDVRAAPPGPFTVKFEATGEARETKAVYFQLYRRGGTGGEAPPNPVSPGRTLVYAEEFDRPLSLSPPSRRRQGRLWQGAIQITYFVDLVADLTWLQVRVVEHKKSHKLYALKYIDKSKCIKQKAVANIIQERRLLEEVRSRRDSLASTDLWFRSTIHLWSTYGTPSRMMRIVSSCWTSC